MASLLVPAMLPVSALLLPLCCGSGMMFHHLSYYVELDNEGFATVGKARDTGEYSDPDQITFALTGLRLLTSDMDVIQNYEFGSKTGSVHARTFHIQADDEQLRYQGVSMRSREMEVDLSELGSTLSVTVRIFAQEGVIQRGTDLETRVRPGTILMSVTLERKDECAICEQDGTKLQMILKVLTDGSVQVRSEGVDHQDLNYLMLDLEEGRVMHVPKKVTVDDTVEYVDSMEAKAPKGEANITLGYSPYPRKFEMATIIDLEPIAEPSTENTVKYTTVTPGLSDLDYEDEESSASHPVLNILAVATLSICLMFRVKLFRS